MNSIQSRSLTFLSFFLLSFSFCVIGQVSLEQVWETPTELKEPESILYDPGNEMLYVSNINDPSGESDGNGSIGKIFLDGEIMEVEWVYGGMNAPKGLGLFNDLLYVADPQKVVVINILSGKVEKTIDVEGAGMLNDITIDKGGDVFVSDSENARIYRIRNNQAEIWLENEHLETPNGLLAHNGKLFMVDMGSGIFYEIHTESKELRKIADGLEGGDGIAAHQDNFIISNWNGEVWYVTDKGKVNKILDTKDEKINAADITYLPQHNLLLVPTFYANKVVAYELK